MKPKIITLCGSTKFKKEFDQLNKELSLSGYIVLSCGVFSHSDGTILTDEQKTMLDDIHKHKILMADQVFIIVKDHYIGYSTMQEIEFASYHNKEIHMITFKKEDNNWIN